MRRSCRLLNKLLRNYSYNHSHNDEVFNGINVEFYGGNMRLFLIASATTISLARSFSTFAQDKATSPQGMQGMSMEKLDASNGNAFDAMFINMMTRHHEGAITMARDALKKAQHKEIKELLQNIIDAQKKKIDQMTTWKKEWKLAGK
jgi:hypothetical protein